MYLFFFSLNPSFWRLLIPTVTWLSMCVQPTPRNVSGQGESTMIWMMSAKMSTITHSLKCWEIGPLEITSRFVPIVESVKLHVLCISVSILAAKLKNNKDYICQCVHWKHSIIRVHLIKHCWRGQWQVFTNNSYNSWISVHKSAHKTIMFIFVPLNRT